MNIIFTTQTVGLKIFYHLLNKISAELNINKVGFYVAHSMYYDKFLEEHSEFESEYVITKEWDIIKQSKLQRPDLDKIRNYEEAIGDPTLWGPIICDRRIYLGKRCKDRQDYHPSFTHEEMLSILQVAAEKLELLLDKIKPNVILSLDPVTFGDYLLYLFAKARNIPMLFFRTTKIKNYIEFSEGIFGCSHHIYKLFKEYERDNLSDQWINEAKTYLENMRKGDIRYEGMILIPSKRNRSLVGFNPINYIKFIKNELNYILRYRDDHHNPGILVSSIYKQILSPLKIKLFNLQYSKNYILAQQLDSLDFAFYPLQSEPEIASLIWGKSYMNQIETIRNIARSLPVGMKLLVKEHPRARGYRSTKYYKKILEIPNVLLVHPDQEVQGILKTSKIVFSIATFVSFEAVLYGIPTIMLGGPRPFTILPDSMIRFVNSTNDLAAEITDLMKNYEHKEKSLVNYIAATMKGSVSVDYFTSLLKKKGRHGDTGVDKFDEEIEKMAGYAIKRIKEVLRDEEKVFYNRVNTSGVMK